MISNLEAINRIDRFLQTIWTTNSSHKFVYNQRLVILQQIWNGTNWGNSRGHRLPCLRDFLASRITPVNHFKISDTKLNNLRMISHKRNKIMKWANLITSLGKDFSLISSKIHKIPLLMRKMQKVIILLVGHISNSKVSRLIKDNCLKKQIDSKTLVLKVRIKEYHKKKFLKDIQI
jgi:hypothetical protein